MTADSNASNERALGRIEQQLADIRVALPELVRKYDLLDDRMERNERTTATRHEQNQSRFEYLAAATDSNGEKLDRVEVRLDALEAPAIRTSKARAAWRARRKKIVGAVLGAFGILWVLGEPIYKAIAEPLVRGWSEHFMGGLFK